MIGAKRAQMKLGVLDTPNRSQPAEVTGDVDRPSRIRSGKVKHSEQCYAGPGRNAVMDKLMLRKLSGGGGMLVTSGGQCRFARL